MTELLVSTAAFLAGSSVSILLRSSPSALIRRQRSPALGPVIAVAAAGAALLQLDLTLNWVANLLLGAGLTALTAWGAAHAAHRSVAAVLVLVALLLPAHPLVGAGAGMAFALVFLRSRLPLVKALAGSLSAIGVLISAGTNGPGLRESAAILLLLIIGWLGAKRASDVARRGYLVGLGLACGYLALAAAGFLLGAVPALSELSRAARLAQTGTSALTAESPDPSLSLAAGSFGDAKRRLEATPARLADLVPGVAQNAAALRALAGAGEQVASAAAATLPAEGGLVVENRQVDLDGLRTTAASVRRTKGAVGEALDSLTDARSASLLPPVADGIEDLHRELAEAWPVLEDLDAGLAVLPDILGGAGPRRYLVTMQTPAELRASGGIVGGFAVLAADNGKLGLTRTGQVQELNAGGDPASRTVDGFEEYLDRYASYQPLQIWQNLTLSPDWPTIGSLASQLYPQSGGEPIDGVIGVDPYALREILTAIGPVDVAPWPIPLDAGNVVSVLMHEQYLFFENPARKEFLTDVAAAVFEKIISGGANLRRLAPALAQAARQDHAPVWMTNEAEQSVVARVDATGELEPPRRGDSLAVVNQNSSGSKIDWFLRRSTEYAVTYDPVLGRAESVLRVTLRNEAPSSGLPNYVIGSAGPIGTRTSPGENRTLFSVYSPLGLEAASLDGQPLEMAAAEELDHNVFSTFLVIPPQAEVTIELRLAGPVDAVNGKYALAVRKQVLPQAEPVRVDVSYADGWEAEGSDSVGLDLERDRRVTFGYRRSDE